METVVRKPLTNLQLELLKTFSHQLEETELLEVKKILAEFFAKRAVEQANAAWDQKGWTDEDVDRLLETKMRKNSKEK
ncbi:hypothetical protein GCM10028806_30880 [Spirosoma terrae]|uniref:Uncharacterized protein n=1 Tax=Spirosoma terrae TaxID=1968276 RepID=A0A6L9L7S8_9BACT|nr:hypothetical protein [Spirosoma terrae]NDU95402.1 hypothetical protein [Spirosoma terrae]